MTAPKIRVSAATFSSPDASALAAFYSKLLGWIVVEDYGGWVRVRPPSGGVGLSFHHEDHYVPPAWPTVPGEQLMMVHLDVAVDDLDKGVEWATELGATPADHQPQPHVRVMLDPDGHPLCLFQAGPRSEFDQVDWAGVER